MAAFGGTQAAKSLLSRPQMLQMRWHGGAGSHDASAADVRIVFITKDGSEQQVTGKAGQDLLDVAHHHGVDLEGACEGSIACSTCHVILEDDVFDMLEEATEDEVRAPPAKRSCFTQSLADHVCRMRGLKCLVGVGCSRTLCLPIAG
jgi:ferredoxin